MLQEGGGGREPVDVDDDGYHQPSPKAHTTPVLLFPGTSWVNGVDLGLEQFSRLSTLCGLVVSRQPPCWVVEHTGVGLY